MPVWFEEARTEFHAALIASGALSVDDAGIPSIADKDNRASVAIARHLTTTLKIETRSGRLSAQRLGSTFEKACQDFIFATFRELRHLRPGEWEVRTVGGRGRSAQIAVFEQYEHLAALDEAVRHNPELQAVLGNAYTIAPDIIVARRPVNDDEINLPGRLVDENVARLTPMRLANQDKALLHAVVSCKWTIRSDRSQNARSEALNLIRNRKGRLPHVVVVTAEPVPTRIASIALGTGDIDCTYHFALPELCEAAKSEAPDTLDLLEMMIEGKRLRDIADLPLDLAI